MKTNLYHLLYTINLSPFLKFLSPFSIQTKWQNYIFYCHLFLHTRTFKVSSEQWFWESNKLRHVANFGETLRISRVFFREIVREELTNKQVIIRLLKLPSLVMPSNIWKRPVCKTTLLFSPAAYPAISYCEMHLP